MTERKCLWVSPSGDPCETDDNHEQRFHNACPVGDCYLHAPVYVASEFARQGELSLLRAMAAKNRAEKRVIHEALTAAGIPSDILGDGVRTCLAGRVQYALDMRD